MVARAMTEDFEAFWRRFPRKVGKLAAQKAFAKARKTATLEQLLAGIDAYVMHKPPYADFCHPATWLNAGRWLDEYEERRTGDDRRHTERRMSYQPSAHEDYDRWPSECLALHGGACGNYAAHQVRMARAS